MLWRTSFWNQLYHHIILLSSGQGWYYLGYLLVSIVQSGSNAQGFFFLKSMQQREAAREMSSTRCSRTRDVGCHRAMECCWNGPTIFKTTWFRRQVKLHIASFEIVGWSDTIAMLRWLSRIVNAHDFIIAGDESGTGTDQLKICKVRIVVLECIKLIFNFVNSSILTHHRFPSRYEHAVQK